MRSVDRTLRAMVDERVRAHEAAPGEDGQLPRKGVRAFRASFEWRAGPSVRVVRLTGPLDAGWIIPIQARDENFGLSLAEAEAAGAKACVYGDLLVEGRAIYGVHVIDH